MKQEKKLSRQQVLHLAKLASLQISETELVKYARQLSETLEYVKNIEEVSRKEPKGKRQSDLTNVYREDKVDTSRTLPLVEALKNSKHKKNNYFVVSRIL